jgi:hypothetical protein
MANIKVPRNVRNAARAAARSGEQIGAGVTGHRRTIVNGFTPHHKSVSWSYQVGDLVKFRDHMGTVRFGTVIASKGSTVEITSAGWTVRLPCQSISLVDRIEDEQ